ncbi:GTP cyclohydrolase I FolE [Bdellovibrio bacteriovorus]|uniref:GTP cyclohydrolase I FolE n=1 Tax=Bdellovibrio bacteriovorus TaxID=959 RepID=UPI003A7FE2D8
MTMAKTTKKTSKKTSKKSVNAKPESQFADVSASVKQILENVRPTPMIHNGLTNEEKIERITEKFTDIMNTLGLDLDDDSLRETPKRVAKMYVNEVFGGLDPKKFPKMTVIENKMNYDQMIVVQNIGCLSFCEHHFLPIDGFATVAYIPNKKVIGLSKINRIVQYFSRRPQVQERLTKQIADCLQYILGTEHIAVHINAKHYCVMMRGIEDTSSTTSTSDLRGHFKSRMETREEFLEHCRTKY